MVPIIRLALVAAFLAVIPSTALGEGQRESPTPWKPFRFRPGPPSVCGSYLVTESALLRGGDDGYVLIEYGYARNVGKSHSVGATGFLGVNSDLMQTGVRLRLVEWLSPSVSLNVSPGIILSGYVDQNTEFVRPQFTAQAGVNLSGRVGLLMEMFTTHLRDTSGFGPPEIRDTEFHVGFRLGAEPGLVGTAGALYLDALLIAGD